LANYKTHKKIGILSSLIFSSTSYFFNDIFIDNPFSSYFLINFPSILLIVLFGIIGSLLPDIDSKSSIPSIFFKTFVYFLFLSVSFMFLVNNKNKLLDYFHLDFLSFSFLLIFVSISFSFFIIKYFQNIMKHRGIIHSIPFAILSSLFIFEFFKFLNFYFLDLYNFSFNSFNISLGFFFGFLTHLILDEYYSVDFLGKKIKKSFGTALKVYDKNNKYGSFLFWSLIFSYFY
jgi:hypothetical protein